jgi:hypothetical protein
VKADAAAPAVASSHPAMAEAGTDGRDEAVRARELHPILSAARLPHKVKSPLNRDQLELKLAMLGGERR